jgi:DNA-directed RNA polymerase subunit M/transcription elongation factor TFIIS
MFRMKIQSKWRVLSRKLLQIDRQIVSEAKKDKKVAMIDEKKRRLAVASAEQMPTKKTRKSKMESCYAVIYRINTVYYYQLQYKRNK